jgi:hypothetical protein
MAVNQAAIHHFESLSRILRELGQEAIELCEHRYHPDAFGSFELVVSRGHTRLKFTWDGRDSLLSVGFANFQNKNAAAPWIHDANFSLPRGEGVYAEIASQSVSMLTR